MRTIIWAFISSLVAVMAVHGLDVSSRRPVRQGTSASFETQPGSVDRENHGGMESAEYAR